MLIFWKLVFPQDAPLFNKDYSSASTLPTLHYIPTDLDRALNLVMGCGMILIFLLSSTLNSLVYRYNSYRPANITNFLFKMLSVVDFLTTFYAPWLYASLMFSSEVYPCTSRLTTSTRQLVCVLGCMSQVITWMLAVTRFVKVILPFTILVKRAVLGYLAGYSILMAANSLSSLVVQWRGGADEAGAMSLLVHYCFLVNLAHCTTGILLSVTTSLYLVRCTRRQAATLRRSSQKGTPGSALVTQRLRGCVTILLMNIPYIITLGFIVFVHLYPGRVSFHDVLFGFLPQLTSTINPIIVTARNLPKMRVLIFGRTLNSSRRSRHRCTLDSGTGYSETSRVVTSPPGTARRARYSEELDVFGKGRVAAQWSCQASLARQGTSESIIRGSQGSLRGSQGSLRLTDRLGLGKIGRQVTLEIDSVSETVIDSPSGTNSPTIVEEDENANAAQIEVFKL